MITVLLEKIITILEGWIQSFTSHAQHVEDKLDSLDQTASDIETNTEPISDIKDNTGAVITPIQNIKSNTDSIATSSLTSANNTTAILNNIGTLSTNTGRAAAYAQDCANNTLDIKDKVTTIASDTTQLRADSADLNEMSDKIYEAIKWSLIDKYINETESGPSPISFDTDIADNLIALNVGIEAQQSGSGDPSPDNVRPITGYSSMSLTVNGSAVSIALGDTYYGGYLDIVSGKLIINKQSYTISNDTGFANYIPSTQYGPYARITTIGIQKIDNNKVLNICSMANGVSFDDRTTNPDIDRIFSDSVGYVNLRPSINVSISNANDIKNRFMGAVIVYELATPIEVQLTAQQIAAIVGINTITSDTNGDIEVTYKESIKYYLDKQDN